MSKKNHRIAHYIVERIVDSSYTVLLLMWLGLALGFSFLYFVLSYTDAHGPTLLAHIDNPWIRFANSLYYSIITATSTGYGDITPMGISKALASIQSICALFIFAAFVTKLISYRQEVALHEVHKLTFDENFHNIREEFFVTRKDFDNIIKTAEEQHELNDDQWEELTTAFRRMQTLLKEIPNFYGLDANHHTIDALREELLLTAVHRTLHRINLTINTLSREGIDWVSHPECSRELKRLTDVGQAIAPLWKERSPHDQMEAFEEIFSLNDSIHDLIEETIPPKEE
jgi:potassium channel LctB